MTVPTLGRSALRRLRGVCRGAWPSIRCDGAERLAIRAGTRPRLRLPGPRAARSQVARSGRDPERCGRRGWGRLLLLPIDLAGLASGRDVARIDRAGEVAEEGR